MENTRNRIQRSLAILTAGLAVMALIPKEAEARRWHFSVNVPFGGYYYNPPVYAPPVGWDYYPSFNPVVDLDVYQGGFVDPSGRGHSQTTVEDRHASYYSPGRNEAITPPQTTVGRNYGPGFSQEIERTQWIGADGRPHSTTINRTTTQDPWGNTHTDTGVTLKSKGGSGSGQVQAPAPNPGAPNNPAPIVKPPRIPGKNN